MTLATCAACHGFVVDPLRACLHCGVAPPRRCRLARFLIGRLAAAGATITLMACYGAMVEPNECYYDGTCVDARRPAPDAADLPDAAAPLSDAAPDDGGIPEDALPDPCAPLDEDACEASDTCSPIYAGINCTNPDGGPCTIGTPCVCESFVFAGCESDGS